MNTCPKCGVTVGDEEEACPRCGIFFAKWRERQDNVAAGNLTRYSNLAHATSSEFNWTILIIICLALAGVIYYLGRGQ